MIDTQAIRRELKIIEASLAHVYALLKQQEARSKEQAIYPYRERKLRTQEARMGLHPLCLAVRKVRAKLRLSQTEMAEKVLTHEQTISRFERGTQLPRSTQALSLLRGAAREAGLKKEANLFSRAIAERMFRHTHKQPPAAA